MTKTMIKKSLRAYISRRKLIFMILSYCKRIWICFYALFIITKFYVFEHKVNGILEVLILFSCLRRIYHG